MRTRMRTLLARIERAEQAVKARSRCSPDCICFLENEQPEFRWRAEAEIAADVPCPLHVRFLIVVKREHYRALCFTSPTSSKGGLIIRRSIKKRCAPVSIWLCGRPETIRVLILSDGTRVPSGGPAVGYTPGSGKRSLCGREA